MRRGSLFLDWMVLSVLLTACAPSSPTPRATPSPQVTETKQTLVADAPNVFESPLTFESPLPAPSTALPALETPEAGRSSVSGMIWSAGGNSPIPQTAIYLSLVQDPDPAAQPMILGPDDNRGDIRGHSDAEGRFVFNNVPAGQYFLYVWAPLNWIAAIERPASEESLLIVLAPDQVIDLERVNVPWP